MTERSGRQFHEGSSGVPFLRSTLALLLTGREILAAEFVSRPLITSKNNNLKRTTSNDQKRRLLLWIVLLSGLRVRRSHEEAKPTVRHPFCIKNRIR